MGQKACAKQRVRIPLPIVVRIATRTVKSHIGSSLFDISLKGRSLRHRQNVTTDVVPNHCIETCQLLGIEDRSVLGKEKCPMSLLPDLA